MREHNIQRALAALITNPHFALNFAEFKGQITEKLQLTAQEENDLSRFYADYNHKFCASTKILSKNRWDNVKQSLPVMCKYIPENKLDKIWRQHLYRTEFDLLTPKNPLLESIVFGEYALQSSELSQHEKQIARYEYLRNKVTFEHHEKFNIYIPKRVGLWEDFDFFNLAIYIDSSCQVHDFESDLFSFMRKQELVNEKTKIFFFKNLIKEGVGSIKLNSKISLILDMAAAKTNLAAIEKSLEMPSRKSFVSLIKQLIDCGVLYITLFNEVQ